MDVEGDELPKLPVYWCRARHKGSDLYTIYYLFGYAY
jgi:hypothetical protein